MECIKNIVEIISPILLIVFTLLVWCTYEKLKNIEIKRDQLHINENATIIYYDLILGFKDLVELRNSSMSEPKSLYFSDDWIKNISALSSVLSPIQLELLYHLYGKLYTFKNHLDCYQEILENPQNNKDTIKLRRYKIEFEDMVNLLFKNFDATFKENIKEGLKEEYKEIIIKLEKNIGLESKKSLL